MPLDVAIGIFLSLGIAEAFTIPASIHLILFGVGSSLLPDIDILPFLWQKPYNHRSWPHYPLIYIPVAIACFVFLGAAYGTLFVCGILAHFVHDTIGLGWGVAWLAPFSKRKFLLFPDGERRAAYGAFMTWLPHEEAAMAEQHANPHWIRDYYLRPNIVAYIEYGAFLGALAMLAWYFR